MITSSVYHTKFFFYHEYFVIFEKPQKMLKIADFANFRPKYLGPQIFPRHEVCGSKPESSDIRHVVSHTFQFAVVSCRARHEGTRHIFRHLFLPLCCNILIFCHFDKILLIYDSEKDVCVCVLLTSGRYFVFRHCIVLFEGGCGGEICHSLHSLLAQIIYNLLFKQAAVCFR